jgi:hypothetical protein
LRFGKNNREIIGKGYKSGPAYWKSMDRLAATSVPGAVQSTSSIEYWFVRQVDLLETLRKKLSAVSTALNQEQKLIADRLAAVEGGMKQVDAVLTSLKSFDIRIPDAIMRDLAEQKRKQTEDEISTANTSRAKPGGEK